MKTLLEKVLTHWSLYLVALCVFPITHMASFYCFFHAAKLQHLAQHSLLLQALLFIIKNFLFTPLIAFVVLPLIDDIIFPLLGMFIPAVRTFKHKPPEHFRPNFKLPRYTHVLYFYSALQVVIVAYSIYLSKFIPFGSLPFYGNILSMGMLGLASTAVSHELIHRVKGFDLWLGKLLLYLISYSHFAIEHIYGHHKRVGTPLDPATAKMGQTLYQFIPYSILWSYIDSWKIELIRTFEMSSELFTQKDLTMYQDFLNIVILKEFLIIIIANRMIKYHVIQFSIWFWVLVLFGKESLMVYALCSMTSIIFLETVNYFEHYGIERRKKPSAPAIPAATASASSSSSSSLYNSLSASAIWELSKSTVKAHRVEESSYEPVTPEHSWDCHPAITSYLLLNIQLHSDHHSSPMKPYEKLEMKPDSSPMMPFNYATMLVLSFIPPLFRYFTHPILLSRNRSK